MWIWQRSMSGAANFALPSKPSKRNTIHPHMQLFTFQWYPTRVSSGWHHPQSTGGSRAQQLRPCKCGSRVGVPPAVTHAEQQTLQRISHDCFIQQQIIWRMKIMQQQMQQCDRKGTGCNKSCNSTGSGSCKKNKCLHCHKFHCRKSHPNTPESCCFWNKAYTGYCKDWICHEMEINYVLWHKFEQTWGVSRGVRRVRQWMTGW